MSRDAPRATAPADRTQNLEPRTGSSPTDANANRPSWKLRSLAELAAQDFGSPGWLLPGLWPGDAYGVIAAESKAGKSWLAMDLAVSIATGTAFLGTMQPGRTGSVILYSGEGSRRATTRRFKAMCADREIDPLGVHNLLIETVPPQLQQLHDDVGSDLRQIERDVKKHAPVLVILDPLYLSLGSVNMASLPEVGRVLRGLQRVVEAAGAALVVVHHWNQTGRGSGFGRMSGAGPEEWGRVLWNMQVRARRTVDDGEGSVVEVQVDARGGEIGDSSFAFCRTVREDDPDDLASPMHYAIERIEVQQNGKAQRMASDVVLQVLTERGTWLTVGEVKEALETEEAWGGTKAPGTRSIQNAVARLHNDGLLERDGERSSGYRYMAKPS